MGIRIVIACVLSIAAMFLALDARAELITGKYHFLMLLMYWPRSFCNSLRDGCEVIDGKFIISSLWPMYEPHFAVRRYNETGCNDVEPPYYIYLETLVSQLGQSRVDELHQYWPSPQKKGKANKKKKRKEADLQVWQQSWRDHGRCFDRPKEPWHYFNTTLELAMEDNFLEVLANDPDHKIVPDNQKLYNKSWITNAINNHIEKAINNHMKVKVSITCIKDTNETFQFHQVRVCYDIDGYLKPCAEEYRYCEGVDEILFPIA